MQSPSSHAAVLIIGAGPAGLALAIELGHRDIACIVIERNDRVGYAPRAKTTNVRTREHMRRWGIAAELAAASPLGLDYPSDVAFVTRLAGYPLARFENAFYCNPAKNSLYSEHAQWIPQYAVEKVMKSHAQSLASVRFYFSHELDSIVQTSTGVIAEVRDIATGTWCTFTSDFLVGADGARSKVRDAIGAKMHGTYGLSRNYNIVFRAPGLAQAHAHGKAIMYWQVNDDVPSLIGPMDQGDTWFFMPTNIKEGVKLSNTEAADLIRRATGIDLPYEILSSDEWVASRLLADRYRDRRVFLIGDACHLHPPFGGYGMNMGVADGVDLGWKLAAVLDGWAGAGLLDSYESERGSVHEFVMDETVANHAVLGSQLAQSGMEADSDAGAAMRTTIGAAIQQNKIREFNTLGVVLGSSYDDSPWVIPDGSPPAPRHHQNFVPSARPGSLAPHAWLPDGTSLYDGFGSGFTLLVLATGMTSSVNALIADAAVVGMPLTVLAPESAPWFDLYGSALALVRPDQYVCWRGNQWPSDGAMLLRQITGRVTEANAHTVLAAHSIN